MRLATDSFTIALQHHNVSGSLPLLLLPTTIATEDARCLCWSAHAQQLRCFTRGLGTGILRCVTRVEIILQSMSNQAPSESGVLAVALRPCWELGLAALFITLAPACPSLQQLRITGGLDRGLLEVFGEEACSKLTRLEVEALSRDALEDLDLIMPNLRHCTLIAPDPGAPLTEAICCSAILSCASLTSIDLGTCRAYFDDSHPFPSGLVELMCSLGPRQPRGLRSLSSLLRLSIRCNLDEKNVELDSLAAFLHAAPALQSLHILGVEPQDSETFSLSVSMTCVPESIADLALLSDRICSGLAVTVTHAPVGGAQPLVTGIVLQLNDLQSGFLASLPQLRGFESIILSETAEASTPGDILNGIHTAFPSLSSLVVAHMYELGDLHLSSLSACSSLRELTLEWADVTAHGVTTLCCCLPTLLVLTVVRCLNCSEEEDALRQLLLAWNLHTEITIIGEDE